MNSINQIGIADVHDYEVVKLVDRLVSFLGPTNVERCLERYHASLKSSGPVFRDYYLKHRHPWWNALAHFFQLQKIGKSIRRNLTEDLKNLAGDAKKVTTLQKIMPDSVRQKYKSDLVDDNRAKDYLFELDTAWHFYQKGYGIKWYEDGSRVHSEFLVMTPELEFNVECKRISVDITRRIRRRDFYRLAEQLIPKIAEMGYSGTIDVILKDRLHSSDKFMAELTGQIVQQISAGNTTGQFQIPFGSVTLDLMPANGNTVNFDERANLLWKRKSEQAHGAVFAKSQNRRPIDPIELTLMCERADKVLDGIGERITKARSQLDESKPGLIVCFLEGVDDLSELAKDSGLQRLSSMLLKKESFSHIAGISYSSEPRVQKSGEVERFYNQALIFRNPNCRYDQVKPFKFLSEEELEA